MAFIPGLTGLREPFAGRIFSVEDVAHGKPAPDVFLHAARSMHVEPAWCTVVEDGGCRTRRRYGCRGVRRRRHARSPTRR
jgi:HAD superfamily hydrolase (TIGR01509 family)